MTSNVGEAYMLPRDATESQRLDAQHEYMRQMSYGHLIHPSVPAHQLKAVADVATGTGLWLRQVAERPVNAQASSRGGSKFVGFDISPQQFPPTDSLPSHLSFVVHDFCEPFPIDYQQEFDLVNVRLVSYAIRAKDLEKVVRHIISLLRPGGYLQWQETDASESWAQPETSTATSCVNYVIAEKIHRGLLPSWSDDLMRLVHLETVSTFEHPSPAVQAGKRAAVMSAATALLKARISRQTTELESLSSLNDKTVQLKELESLNETLAAVERSNDTNSSWDFDVTWIVARKAIILNNITMGWMTAKKNASQAPEIYR
ncbi:MAG: hypothetical protein Q9222_007498 [Ikaeria aurantiellina]